MTWAYNMTILRYFLTISTKSSDATNSAGGKMRAFA